MQTRTTRRAWTRGVRFQVERCFWGGSAISWVSRTQRVTATGTSESEYVALWEGITEVLFLRQVQEFVTPTINDYSVIVNEDNQGAIRMANNKFSSKRTRHIDVKHHAIRDAVEEERLKSNIS